MRVRYTKPFTQGRAMDNEDLVQELQAADTFGAIAWFVLQGLLMLIFI